MSADESGAPWPYEDFEPSEEEEAIPTWECPGGQCACHAGAQDKVERVPHRIAFYNHKVEKMPGARCRVLEHGHLINEEAPFANGSGEIDVELHPSTRHLLVEWAPAELPTAAVYPYRRLYYVDVGRDRDMNVERRLHNIGYGRRPTLSENVVDFQQSYGRDATGDPGDIESELIEYHDSGHLPPPTGAGQGEERSFEKTSFLADKDDAGGGGGGSKAKKGDGKKGGDDGNDKQGGNPGGGPGQKGGPLQQGTLSGTTQFKLKLVMQFCLRRSDFNSFDTQWGSDPYDVDALLKDYYPKGDMMKRFAGGILKAFEGAEVTFKAPGAPDQTATLTSTGEHNFNVPAGKGTRKITIRVVARKDRQSPTNKPAGPGLTTKDTKADLYFRPFTAEVEVDDDGALVAGKTKIDVPKPAHARMFSEKGSAKGGSELVIDWRPDWIRASEEKATSPRHTNAAHKKKNPFDASLTREEQAKWGPMVVVHQTTRKEIAFIKDFVGNVNKDSIHYGVDLDGFIVKTVDEHYATGHAGPSMWRQRVDCRDFSVGIETCHSDRKDPNETTESGSTKFRRFFREQLEALTRLLDELQGAFPIPRRNVVGHVEVRTMKNSPSRVLSRDKVNCPGYMLDWPRLEDNGVALQWAPINDPAPKGRENDWARIKQVRASPTIKAGTSSAEVKIIKEMLFDIGYSVSETPVARDKLTDKYDTACQEAVRAFQTRHLAAHRAGHTMFGKPTPQKPLLTTLDPYTIGSITQVWWAAENDQIKPAKEARAAAPATKP